MSESNMYVQEKVFLILDKIKSELTQAELNCENCLYDMEVVDENEDFLWPGVIIYREDISDISITVKPGEIDQGDIFLLCIKAWDGDEKEIKKPVYSEWVFPLPPDEITSEYLTEIIDMFKAARKEGFVSKDTSELPEYVKEIARLQGLRSILEELGGECSLSFYKGDAPSIWIFDGYEDEEGDKTLGYLLKLTYTSLDEDAEKWLLAVECSGDADGKVFPADPVLEGDIKRLFIPEFGGLQSPKAYGRIIETIEGMAS